MIGTEAKLVLVNTEIAAREVAKSYAKSYTDLTTREGTSSDAALRHAAISRAFEIFANRLYEMRNRKSRED